MRLCVPYSVVITSQHNVPRSFTNDAINVPFELLTTESHRVSAQSTRSFTIGKLNGRLCVPLCSLLRVTLWLGSASQDTTEFYNCVIDIKGLIFYHGVSQSFLTEYIGKFNGRLCALHSVVIISQHNVPRSFTNDALNVPFELLTTEYHRVSSQSTTEFTIGKLSGRLGALLCLQRYSLSHCG